MSEEKPTFKVTDRRLFNTDGTPRDIEREEAPPAITAPESVGDQTPTPSPVTQSSEREDAPPVVAPSPSGQSGATTSVVRGDAEPVPILGAEPAVEEGDSQEFLMVIEFIASFAADALGLVDRPGPGGREVNLPLAKQCIDMLGTVQKKTRGNLNAEEQQFFELILSQLRMQYVSLTNRTGGGGLSGPRGFSGSDITGGR